MTQFDEPQPWADIQDPRITELELYGEKVEWEQDEDLDEDAEPEDGEDAA